MTQLGFTGVGQVDIIQKFMICSLSYFQTSTIHGFSQTWLMQEFQIILSGWFELSEGCWVSHEMIYSFDNQSHWRNLSETDSLPDTFLMW